MADRIRHDRPPQHRAEAQQQQQQRQQTSPRLQPSSADDHHSRTPVEAPRASMAATVTLPSIHEARGTSGYASQAPPPAPAAGRPYSHDPRFASPNAVNGYPPPSAGQHPSSSTYLPPLQTSPTDTRSPMYPPPDQRTGYYEERRPPSQYADHHQAQQYAAEVYYRGPPSGLLPPNGYPRPPQSPFQDYIQSPGGGPAMAQAAPRQRTSIACKYCRKRKIRCSGYQNTPGGKCQNCTRMSQECIFQPVSSSSSTAFIPVSAVPGGVPPGTQLFGAYGQPLGPNAMAVGHPYPPQHHGGPPPNFFPQQQQQQQQQQQAQAQPRQSPTESFSSYGDDNAQMVGRRRRRTLEEREEGYRLPPPRGSGGPEEEGRRRSPAELSNSSSPGGGLAHLSYQAPPWQSPHNASALPQPSGPGGRSPGASKGSNGGPATGRQPTAATSQAPNASSVSVMSLSNLVEKHDIDRTMIDRLNHGRDFKSANSCH